MKKIAQKDVMALPFPSGLDLDVSTISSSDRTSEHGSPL
jgi:hypothetical protein